MKKSITIVTLNDPENYGNRLQNYALMQMLRRYGTVYTAFCAGFRPLPACIARVFHPGVQWIKRILSGIRRGNLLVRIRHHRKCVSFTKHYVPDSYESIDVINGVRPSKHITDWYVFGSDQIWNYHSVQNKDRLRCFALYLGSFLPFQSKALSYAASIGVSSEPSTAVQGMFKKYLPNFAAISVREFRGKEIIQQMTGLRADVVLDPTLMLSSEQWLKITEGFVPESDRYVLTYFLGHPSEEQEKLIQEYAHQHGCRIRRILDLRDSETYIAGPQDFVELFAKAQYVFTDSYHACCFSIIFRRQFTVYNRSGFRTTRNMNSRMDTLSQLFELESVVRESGLAPHIDYDRVGSLLRKYQCHSQQWLDSAMV